MIANSVDQSSAPTLQYLFTNHNNAWDNKAHSLIVKTHLANIKSNTSKQKSDVITYKFRLNLMYFCSGLDHSSFSAKIWSLTV